MKLLRHGLYDKQKEGARLALRQDAFSLWMEQGTGKTITALKVIGVRWRRKGLRLVLVVGPKIIPGSWRRQIEEHFNVPCEVLIGKQGLSRVSRTRPDKLTFLILNYELLWRRYRELVKLPIDMIVADEAHRLRRRTSRQSKLTRKLARNIPYRLALTGTPQGKNEVDLFAQLDFTHPDFFGSWKDFEKKYLRKTKIYKPEGGHWFKIRLKPKAAEQIAKRVAPYVFRIAASEMLDLPGVSHKVISFPLTGKAAKAYRDMERDLIVELEDYKATSKLAIVKRMKLAQLTGGYLSLDDGSLLRLERNKLAHLEDWLEDLPDGEKIVFFARFTHEIDDIVSLLKKRNISYAVRDGRTKPKDMDAWQLFQTKSKPQAYVAQIAAGGIGIDLFASRFAVFYSVTENWIDYDQAWKRLVRNGQKRSVVLVRMIAENTIDDDLYNLLDEKCLTSDALMRRIKDRRAIMAKKTKNTEADAAPAEETKKKKAPPPRQSAEFGPPKVVAGLLAKKIDLDASEVRALLRNDDELLEKYKTDAGWDFGDQKTVDKVVEKVAKAHADRAAKRKERAEAEAAAKAKKAEEAEAEGEEEGEDGEEEGEEEAPAEEPEPKKAKKPKKK